MTTKQKLFLESKAWVEEKLSLDKDYFVRLDGMHNPRILWIGSVDALLSVREVTNTDPGEILVYRNLASQVRKDDISMMAMIQAAVEVEEVESIVVCGYSHCSGARDVLRGTADNPYLKNWLAPLRKIYEDHRQELDSLEFSKKEKRLCELNIEAQIRNLSQLECVQRAWEKSDRPFLYGWYFDLYTGTLKEVFSLENNHHLQKVASLVEPVAHNI